MHFRCFDDLCHFITELKLIKLINRTNATSFNAKIIIHHLLDANTITYPIIVLGKFWSIAEYPITLCGGCQCAHKMCDLYTKKTKSVQFRRPLELLICTHASRWLGSLWHEIVKQFGNIELAEKHQFID